MPELENPLGSSGLHTYSSPRTFGGLTLLESTSRAFFSSFLLTVATNDISHDARLPRRYHVGSQWTNLINSQDKQIRRRKAPWWI